MNSQAKVGAEPPRYHAHVADICGYAQELYPLEPQYSAARSYTLAQKAKALGLGFLYDIGTNRYHPSLSFGLTC